MFGNIGKNSGGGVHTLYGLDLVSDVRFAFDYGVTNNLTIGVGRSKQLELLDASFKYRILTQTTDNHIPFSLAIYNSTGYVPTNTNAFYRGVSIEYELEKTFVDRFTYVTQLVIARKMTKRLSIVLNPTLHYRNYILKSVNTENGATETNELFAMGSGLRYKITSRLVFVIDYFYTFSKYRQYDNLEDQIFQNPFAIGIEIETGGHVFHINFSNASAIQENVFIPKTTDSWLDGGYKFGFNISRVFNVGKH
jgi:hypothetical protein